MGCQAWVDGTGSKPSTCSGTKTDGCYKGLPPISTADGAWCVDGQLSTCQKYCIAVGTCPADFCASDASATASFAEECQAWVDGTGSKPSTCSGTKTDGCYKGLPPISTADGAWCVDGQLSTCQKYCTAVGTCPADFCASAATAGSFAEECKAWVDGIGSKPSTCSGTKTDGCYEGLPPISTADGAWCVDGQLSTCQKYCTAVGTCPADFCASAPPSLSEE